MDGKHENVNHNSGRLDQFQDRGFIVRYNPKEDGNCQFSGASY